MPRQVDPCSSLARQPSLRGKFQVEIAVKKHFLDVASPSDAEWHAGTWVLLLYLGQTKCFMDVTSYFLLCSEFRDKRHALISSRTCTKYVPHERPLPQAPWLKQIDAQLGEGSTGSHSQHTQKLWPSDKAQKMSQAIKNATSWGWIDGFDC